MKEIARELLRDAREMWRSAPRSVRVGAVAAVVLSLGFELCKRSRGKPKVFISYDYDEDARYKRLLTAWSKNSRFRVEFKDHSTDVSVNSRELAPIRRVISQRIRESAALLVIVGERTHESPWVRWEIEKAKELGTPLVAVKLKKKNKAPEGLYGVNASWALCFGEGAVVEALAKAIG